MNVNTIIVLCAILFLIGYTAFILYKKYYSVQHNKNERYGLSHDNFQEVLLDNLNEYEESKINTEEISIVDCHDVVPDVEVDVEEDVVEDEHEEDEHEEEIEYDMENLASFSEEVEESLEKSNINTVENPVEETDKSFEIIIDKPDILVKSENVSYTIFELQDMKLKELRNILESKSLKAPKYLKKEALIQRILKS